MKKLLLSLLSVVAMGSAASAATDVTVDFSTASGLPTAESETASTATIEGIDFSFVNCKQGKYQQATYIQISGKNYQGKAYMTFTLEQDLTKFVATTGSNASVSVSVQLSANGNNIGNAVKLDGKNSEFTFTIPAEYQAAGTVYKLATTNKYNAQFSKIVFTTESSTDTRKPAGLSFTEPSVSKDFADGSYTLAVTNPNNLTVSYTSSNENVATVNNSGLVTLKAAGTTKITASSEATTEFKAGSASYTLSITKDAESIAELIAGQNNANVKIGFPMTVGFVNFSNVFATDGKDWIQIYQKDNGFKAGSVIPAGWSATYTLYNNTTPELKDCVDLPTATETAELKLKEYTNAADVTVANVNEVLILKGVTLAVASPATKDNFTGTMNGETVSLRNNYTIPSVEAGKYDIKAVCTIYKNEPSLYVIEFMEDSTSGIDDVVTDGENTPAEYYNLQGIRVENPAKGLYIRKQGNKAEKVYVK